MAAARLRKTFRYPEDDSENDDTHRGLDEEGEGSNNDDIMSLF